MPNQNQSRVPMKRMNAQVKGKVVGIEETRNGKTFVSVYDAGELYKVYLGEDSKVKTYKDALASGTTVDINVQISSVDFYVREAV